MRWLRFIFTHSFFVALCAVALCAETVLLFKGPHSVYLYLFVGLATLASYNFHLLMGALYHQRPPHWRALLRQQPMATVLLLLTGAGLCWVLGYLRSLWPWVALAFVATALYSLALLPWRPMAQLRRLGFAKTLLLALTWAFVTAFLPLQAMAPNRLDVPGTDGLLLLLYRFCLMLQICWVFDLRDTALDKIKGLHSLATDLRPAVANRLFYVLAMVCVALGVWLTVYWHWWGWALVVGTVQVAAIVLYRVPLRRRGYLYYYFLVDGLMLLSALLTAAAVAWRDG
jgi:hypothetical protein